MEHGEEFVCVRWNWRLQTFHSSVPELWLNQRTRNPQQDPTAPSFCRQPRVETGGGAPAHCFWLCWKMKVMWLQWRNSASWLHLCDVPPWQRWREQIKSVKPTQDLKSWRMWLKMSIQTPPSLQSQMRRYHWCGQKYVDTSGLVFIYKNNKNKNLFLCDCAQTQSVSS